MPATDQHDGITGNHHREQPGNLPEEVHQQACEPGAGAPGGVIHASIVADTRPPGVRRTEGKQRHRQIDAQHNHADNRTLSGPLGHQAAKALLFFCQFRRCCLFRFSGFRHEYSNHQ